MKKANPSPWSVDFEMTSAGVQFIDDIAYSFATGRDPEAQERARDKAKRRGLKVLGEGASRVVLKATEDFDGVIEASHGVTFKVNGRGQASGKGANMIAVENWLNLPVEAKQYLLPLLAYSDNDLWIAQPVATAHHSQGSVGTVNAGIREAGYKCKDTRIENVGTFMGESVLFDYGQPCFSWGP